MLSNWGNVQQKTLETNQTTVSTENTETFVEDLTTAVDQSVSNDVSLTAGDKAVKLSKTDAIALLKNLRSQAENGYTLADVKLDMTTGTATLETVSDHIESSAPPKELRNLMLLLDTYKENKSPIDQNGLEIILKGLSKVIDMKPPLTSKQEADLAEALRAISGQIKDADVEGLKDKFAEFIHDNNDKLGDHMLLQMAVNDLQVASTKPAASIDDQITQKLEELKQKLDKDFNVTVPGASFSTATLDILVNELMGQTGENAISKQEILNLLNGLLTDIKQGDKSGFKLGVINMSERADYKSNTYASNKTDSLYAFDPFRTAAETKTSERKENNYWNQIIPIMTFNRKSFEFKFDPNVEQTPTGSELDVLRTLINSIDIKVTSDTFTLKMTRRQAAYFDEALHQTPPDEAVLKSILTTAMQNLKGGIDD
ncbi:MAG: hypothetical protein ACAI44_01840 [Candidatus Sericytochromatia bacterium]